jgi:hypothetical protein
LIRKNIGEWRYKKFNKLTSFAGTHTSRAISP